MGQSTFTGPLKAGTIPDSGGNGILGNDVANVGWVVMNQSKPFTQAASAGQAAGVYSTNIVIPANSQILGITINKTTAFDGAAQTVNIGTSATATELAVAADNNLSTTLGLLEIIPGNSSPRTSLWKNVGTTDVRIWVKSANTGNGVGIISVRYAQNINL